MTTLAVSLALVSIVVNTLVIQSLVREVKGLKKQVEGLEKQVEALENQVSQMPVSTFGPSW